MPLISAARRLGYEDHRGQHSRRLSGIYLCRWVLCTRIFPSRKRSLRKAKELNIDGITTCGMDTGIRAIGKSVR